MSILRGYKAEKVISPCAFEIFSSSILFIVPSKNAPTKGVRLSINVKQSRFISVHVKTLP